MAVIDQFMANPPTGVNNTFVNVDQVYGAQCWDLVELYAEKLGVPKAPWAITLGPQLAAKEAWIVFDAHMQKYFVKIPKGQQQRGDINVYDGHGIYTEGHINIDLANGQVFEQNADPDHSPAHISTRATTYLLGSIRLKGENDMVPDIHHLDAIFQRFFGRNSTVAEQAEWIGKKGYTELIDVLQSQQAYKDQVHYSDVGFQTVTKGVTPLKSGLYQV